MKIEKFEDFFELQNLEPEDKEQFQECWLEAQKVLRKDAGLTFSQLSEANRERQASVEKFKDCEDWTPSDWVTAIVGELGEAANKIKKKRRGENIPISEIIDELADVIVYVDILLQFYSHDTGAVIASKFNEVSERVGSDVRV